MHSYRILIDVMNTSDSSTETTSSYTREDIINDLNEIVWADLTPLQTPTDHITPDRMIILHINIHTELGIKNFL